MILGTIPTCRGLYYSQRFKETILTDTIKLYLEFPRSLVEGFWIDEATASAEMKEAVVLDLFRQKRISIRKGAKLLGLSYRGFLALLSRRQVPIAE